MRFSQNPMNTRLVAATIAETDLRQEGGAVAQSVEEVPGSIPAVAARSLLVGSVSV